jgi:hypothetical protein
MIVSRRIASCLPFVVLICSAGMLHAAPLDAPDIVYIDGVPCNSLCQSYMAWSREIRAAGSAQHPAAARRTTDASPAESRPAAHSRVARDAALPARDVHRRKSTAPARAVTASRAPQAKSANADQIESASTKQTEPLDDRRVELPNTSQAKPPSNSQADAAGIRQPDTSDARKAEAPDAPQAEMPKAPQAKPSNIEFAEAPSTGQAEPSSANPAEAPASLPRIDSTATSGTRSVREQIMAAATVAEQLTDATNATTEPNAMRSDKPRSSGDAAGDMTASTSPSAADTLVALLVSRPEIKSMSDLTGKNVAIDKTRAESESNVRTALVAAGAPEVELSSDDSKAIDRLVDGQVPAAVVALVSPDAAEAFPDVAGFKVFHIPLSPRSIKTETDKP